MEKKNPTICLLGVSFGANNMGMNALAAGTLKAFVQHYPQGELILLEYGKEQVTFNVEMGGKIFPVPLINIRFSKKFYLKNNIALLIALALLAKLIPFGQFRRKLIAENFWLSRMANADLVVSMAGGDSFSDIYGLGRLLYVSLPQFLALVLGKNMVILPQTIGPFNSVLAKIMARTILRRAELVYSRDKEGVVVARELMGLCKTDRRIQFCYDVGFVLDAVRPKSIAPGFDNRGVKGKSVIGLNISGLLYMGGYSRNNMFGLKIDYKKFIPELIDLLISKHDSIVMLVPHVFGRDGESDSLACREIYSFLNERYKERLLSVDDGYNESEIKYIIGLCDFFIGSRMHACIAALSQSVPTVSIAYSSKFIGVMQTIGVAELVADPRKLEKADLFRLISDVFERKAEFRDYLDRTMPGVKKAVLNLFNEIGPIPGKA